MKKFLICADVRHDREPLVNQEGSCGAYWRAKPRLSAMESPQPGGAQAVKGGREAAIAEGDPPLRACDPSGPFFFPEVLARAGLVIVKRTSY
jgi:hypothetical protein